MIGDRRSGDRRLVVGDVSEHRRATILDRISIDGRAEYQAENHGERDGERPTERADGDGSSRARVVERLAYADDHGGEHPDRSECERGNRHAWQYPKDS